MTRLIGGLLLVLGLVATGCGATADGGSGRTDDPGSGPSAPQPPTGADDVVLRVTVGGGFVPIEYAFGNRPSVLVTGDGRVLTPQPPPAGTPTRLLPVVVHTIDAEELADLLAEADDAGLLGDPPDYTAGAPDVTDMASTTVEITADGHTYEHSAYALGFEAESGDREALAEFVADVEERFADGATQPYRPTAVRLRATEPIPGGAVAAATPWPAAGVDLASVGDCTVVDDPAAVADVVEQLGGADYTTSFSQGGRSWSVTGTVVLPGETRPCADW